MYKIAYPMPELMHSISVLGPGTCTDRHQHMLRLP
uniref:Uncharacterized protein n=1 Tax=Anguilla anguilla TaxID=7936 RepID=A0A0E9RR13_ANGAN